MMSCLQRLSRAFPASIVAITVASGVTIQAQGQTHDKAYWRAVAKAEYKVPVGTPLPALLDELTGLLGHPDPELRDDIAYTTLAQWIYRQKVVPPEQRARLMDVWLTNLKTGIGEAETPSVLRRSFSALALGLLAITDNEAPYLEPAAFTRLFDSALVYLREERDVRGYDATLGWLHSVAHTADLLKFLARSTHLSVPQQARVLTAISDKIAAVSTPLVHGEDERLARAILSIAARGDFDESGFSTWVTRVASIRPATPMTPATLAVAQNRRNLLVSLYTVLSTDRRELPTIARTRGAAAVLTSHFSLI
jgi:hypothetical protein